eukprot:TRINITY_DN5013_c0_g1_i1.p1 TRINITY_DN5013_c0_g1~~TRINITY_DN5013_c0_g1_i1.p1  ORF type:complete len:543 (+),score=135.59 TRINITY_DN5013_c0_g1_i1:24-1631(+)
MAPKPYDVLIIGCGFGGMSVLQRLRGEGFDVVAVDTASDVGGTWYWNRYPGARCDVPSVEYSYQFDEEIQQEWSWKERYSAQPEILEYANMVADKHDLRKNMIFNTKVTKCVWNDESSTWTITTDKDDVSFVTSHVVLATGCLSAPNKPSFVGLDTFKGTVLYTSQWPHEKVDLSDKRVAVVGTGSSGIQSIPLIAAEAGTVTVYQRTPNYVVPARNREQDKEFEATTKASYREFREANLNTPFGMNIDQCPKAFGQMTKEEATAELESRYALGGFYFMGAFLDQVVNPECDKFIAAFLHEKIRSFVTDPVKADILCPTGQVACKRLPLDTNYFEAFNKETVSIISVKENPIESVSETGIKLADGSEKEFDVIVFATGFDAMTGSATRIDIHGKSDQTLKQYWGEGPRTYLGLQVHGFPNLFTVSGPQSPSVLSNMMPSIEQHTNYIADIIVHLRDCGKKSIEADLGAQTEWVAHTHAVASSTLFGGADLGCNSWYLGSNIPGKPRNFMPYIGFNTYRQKCIDVAKDGYTGFVIA